MKQSGNILVSVSIIIVVVIISVFYFIKSAPPKPLPIPTPVIPSPVSAQDATERIVIQDDLYFDVLIPKDYNYQPRPEGDLLGQIISSDGKKSVVFYKSTGGGERSPRTTYTIDDIPFVMQYTDSLTCPAWLDTSDIKTHEGAFTYSVIFGISLSCDNEKDTNPTDYKKIISSIKFSPKLRRVLTGEEVSPLLKNSPYTLGELKKKEEEYLQSVTNP